MSTLEKFGILVILILVVIIGVVAVWGVGGEDKNPFEATENAVANPEPGVPPPDSSTGPMPWPAPAPGPGPVAGPAGSGAVAPPAVQAPVTPPGAMQPAPAVAGTTYRIKKGDTLSGIAAATLGDRNKYKLILDANPGLDARRLKIGQEIVIPSGTSVASTGTAPRVPAPNSLVAPNPADGPSEPPVAAPAPASGVREVEVRAGDTLFEISRRELGDPNLYYKLIKANPGIDPKRLRAGQKIKVPVE